jgi:hypothetical protein
MIFAVVATDENGRREFVGDGQYAFAQTPTVGEIVLFPRLEGFTQTRYEVVAIEH